MRKADKQQFDFYISAAKSEFSFAKRAIANIANITHVSNAWRFIRLAASLSGISEDTLRERIGDT